MNALLSRTVSLAVLSVAFAAVPLFAHAAGASVTYSTGGDVAKIYGGNPSPTYTSSTWKKGCTGMSAPYTCYTGLDAWVDWNGGSYLGGSSGNNFWMRAIDAFGFSFSLTPPIAPNASVTYHGVVTDAVTGIEIPPNSTVTPGQKLTFTFPAYVPSDLGWYTPSNPIWPGCTSYTSYAGGPIPGHWQAGATPPSSVSCSSDYFGGYEYVSGGAPVGCSTINGGYSMFAPFMVNPPARSMTNMPGFSSCTPLTTDAGGNSKETCTVSAPVGTDLLPTFSVGDTYGKFYFRAQRYAPTLPVQACKGNNRALAVEGSSSDYKMTIPGQTIPYPLTTGATGNQPPSPPTIDGPTTGDICNAATFTFTSTDPNGDTIRYGIDWDDDGVVDEWLPSSGYVASGSSESVTRQFIVANFLNTTSFQVLAQDSKGATSAWTPHDIAVGLGTCGMTAILTDNGPVVSGSTAKLTWSCGVAASSKITNASGATPNGTVSPPAGGTISTSALMTDTTYTLTCTDFGGKTDTDTTTVRVDKKLVINSCTPSVTSVPANTNMTWSANVSGGSGSYGYTWASADGTPAGATSASYVTKYASGGAKTATLKVIDLGDGQSASTNCTGLTVASAAVSLTCSVTPSGGYQGDTFTWTATASGGSGSYDYVWSGAVTGSCNGISGPCVKSAPAATAGPLTASVTVTSGGTASCTVSPKPTVNACQPVLSPSTQTIDQGDAASFTLGANGTNCGYTPGKCTFADGTPYSNKVYPPNTANYAVTCDGTYGSATGPPVLVNVRTPDAQIQANGQTGSTRVNPGVSGNVTLTWSSANVSSCTVTKNGARLSTNPSSAGLSQTVSSQTVYKIDCVNEGGTHATDQVVVNVNSVYQNF